MLVHKNVIVAVFVWHVCKIKGVKIFFDAHTTEKLRAVHGMNF